MPTFTLEQKAIWYGVFAKVELLAEWAKQKEMSEICWSTFCAVCSAFLVEGFIKALDGIGSGFPIGNVNPNASPFNLVCCFLAAWPSLTYVIHARLVTLSCFMSIPRLSPTPITRKTTTHPDLTSTSS